MTALDRAFIKAYAQKHGTNPIAPTGDAVTRTPIEAAGPVPANMASAAELPAAVAAARAASEMASPVAATTASATNRRTAATGDKSASEMSAAQTPHYRIDAEHKPPQPKPRARRSTPRRRNKPETPDRPSVAARRSAGEPLVEAAPDPAPPLAPHSRPAATAPTAVADLGRTLSAPTIEDVTVGLSRTTSAMAGRAARGQRNQSARAVQSTAGEPASLASGPLSAFALPSALDAIDQQVEPLLQVDRFVWPRECAALCEREPDAWEQFAAQVLAEAHRGRKIVAIGGCGRTAGRTTVAICLARLLMAHGAEVVLVDADVEKPELARRLGISPPAGWDAVVKGEVPLGEVLIGSAEESLVLAPLRPAAQPPSQLTDSLRAAGMFGLLRDSFDVVLVDLGPVGPTRATADFQSQAALARPDVVYLVRDCRSLSLAEASAIAGELTRAGLAVAGLIENFAPPEEHREAA